MSKAPFRKKPALPARRIHPPLRVTISVEGMVLKVIKSVRKLDRTKLCDLFTSYKMLAKGFKGHQQRIEFRFHFLIN